MISNCGHDEHGQYKYGQAGDQTWTEWTIVNWYSYPWNVMLRYPNAEIRHWMGDQARAAALNNNIGYDQLERQTFWQQLVKSGYDASKINTPCETDCSAGVLAICKAAGYHFNIEALKNINQTGYTGNEEAILKAAGFEAYREYKYLSSDAYLDNGDILLNTMNHTAFNVTQGNQVQEKEVKTTSRPNGIDVSGYQPVDITNIVSYDFVGVKITQGTGYINPYWKKQVDYALAKGAVVLGYHYANGSGVNGEVNFYLQTLDDYISKVIPALDWETTANSSGKNSQYTNVSYAKAWLDGVKTRSGGKNCFVYGSKDSCFNAMNWDTVVQAGYKCWGAQYANNNIVMGYQADPWQSTKNWGAWKQDVSIHQYTSNLRLPGYGDRLDGDISYMSIDQLRNMAKGGSNAEIVIPPETENLDKASLLELVAQVQEGKLGTGETRKKNLGNRYDEVQKMINYIYSTSTDELATQVITGKYGNTELRKRVLGSRYNDVQRAVNQKLNGLKDVTTLAREVLAGKWGNDPERTKKLRAAGYDSTEVQKEVNRLLGVR